MRARRRRRRPPAAGPALCCSHTGSAPSVPPRLPGVGGEAAAGASGLRGLGSGVGPGRSREPWRGAERVPVSLPRGNVLQPVLRRHREGAPHAGGGRSGRAVRPRVRPLRRSLQGAEPLQGPGRVGPPRADRPRPLQGEHAGQGPRREVGAGMRGWGLRRKGLCFAFHYLPSKPRCPSV